MKKIEMGRNLCNMVCFFGQSNSEKKKKENRKKKNKKQTHISSSRKTKH